MKTLVARLTLLAVVLAAAVALGACGDDDNGNGDPDTSPTATADGLPDNSPEVGGVQAVGRYLAETGLGGDTGEFTDPVGCADLPEGFVGDFCIAEPSVYAPALLLLFVVDADDQDDNAWQVRAVLEDDEWQVTEVTSLTDE